MRKVIMWDMVSVDGFFEAPGHDISWFVFEDELAAYIGETQLEADTLLFGRVTYEMMAAYWPSAEGDIATFFIHEVQHDADQHRPGESWEVVQPPVDPTATKVAPQWTYNSYQTEFRAYWMMNAEGSTADWFGSSHDVAVTNFAITAVDVGIDLTLGGGDDKSVAATTASWIVRKW